MIVRYFILFTTLVMTVQSLAVQAADGVLSIHIDPMQSSGGSAGSPTSPNLLTVPVRAVWGSEQSAGTSRGLMSVAPAPALDLGSTGLQSGLPEGVWTGGIGSVPGSPTVLAPWHGAHTLVEAQWLSSGYPTRLAAVERCTTKLSWLLGGTIVLSILNFVLVFTYSHG